LARSELDNSLCLDCHDDDAAFSSPAAIMQHTGHAYDPVLTGASRCTGCHHVASRRERIATDLPRLSRGAGFLGIVTPRQTLRMFRDDPDSVYIDSCNRCHVEWRNGEAGYTKGVAAYNALFRTEAP
jgi:hypothetical protein